MHKTTKSAHKMSDRIKKCFLTYFVDLIISDDQFQLKRLEKIIFEDLKVIGLTNTTEIFDTVFS